jgi:GT2 family glycosyltransferase
MNKDEKIAIGWIDSGTVLSPFAAFVSQILLERHDLISDICVATGPYLTVNRNEMVNRFLHTDADWLLSLDSDVLVDVESFDNLIKNADPIKTPILAGVYYVPLPEIGQIVISGTAFKEGDPLGEDISGMWVQDFETKEMIENLHDVGLGYCLIHRSVFEKILKDTDSRYPWFKEEWVGEPVNSWVSDDVFFCNLARKHGFNISMCTSARSSHLKTARVNDNVYFSSKEIVKQAVAEQQAIHDKHFHKKNWWTVKKGK